MLNVNLHISDLALIAQDNSPTALGLWNPDLHNATLRQCNTAQRIMCIPVHPRHSDRKRGSDRSSARLTRAGGAPG